jgi:deoxyribodipyrimidine photo-lyase
MVQLVWFKRDLRSFDHRPLFEASRAGPVLPLYVIEPDYWAQPDMSRRQFCALRDGLEELAGRLAHLGAPLIVRTGKVTDILARIHAKLGITRLLAHEETGTLWGYARDRAVQDFCRQANIDFVEYPQFGVVRGLRDRDQWGRAHAALMRQPPVPEPERLQAVKDAVRTAIPTAEQLGLRFDGCVEPQSGSRHAGLALLDSFLAGRGANYRRAMSSPLGGESACSRLSVSLATGALSLRELFHRLERERRALSELPASVRPVPTTAIDSLVARLHWHCHFIQKLDSQPDLDRRSMHPMHRAARRYTAADDPRLLAWASGQTGFPFVDACMRSLIATGWLNFRMRAMVVAFACYQLDLDWAAVGTRLARLFTDYEPGIHWSQVQMQAGQTGINTPRLYNPVKQGLDQDPDGRFTRFWVPELDPVPLALLQQPWKSDLVCDYPPPLVDHQQAAREARSRLTALRATPGYRQASLIVFRRHGSRKRRFNQDNPTQSAARARAAQPRPKRQLAFDL